MGDTNTNVTGAGLVEQVQTARRKKKIEALKGKISKKLDDREEAAKALAAIDQAILDDLTEAGLSADEVAAVLG